MAKTGKDQESKDAQAKAEAVQPLKVEINFPAITDLKQAIATDSDGNLLTRIQFTARVDQFEIFRLINLLKQPHGALYVTIGSNQSALDFKFDPKNLRFQIFQSAKRIEDAKKDKDTVADKTDVPVEEAANQAVKIEAVRFNHEPGEKLKFGVFIEYSVNGSTELKSATGRGKNPTAAVIAGVKQTGAVFEGLNEPFEVRAALEALEPSGECYKLIRVLDVGSFDVDEKGAEPAKEGE